MTMKRPFHELTLLAIFLLVTFLLAAILMLLLPVQRTAERAAEAAAQTPALPPPTPIVVYSDRPWLLEGDESAPEATFMFTRHEWETLTNALGPVESDGTLLLPQGRVRRLDRDAFMSLRMTLPKESVRTNAVWIVTGGSEKGGTK